MRPGVMQVAPHHHHSRLRPLLSNLRPKPSRPRRLAAGRALPPSDEPSASSPDAASPGPRRRASGPVRGVRSAPAASRFLLASVSNPQPPASLGICRLRARTNPGNPPSLLGFLWICGLRGALPIQSVRNSSRLF